MEFTSVSLTHRPGVIPDVSLSLRTALSVVLALATFSAFRMNYNDYELGSTVVWLLHHVNLPFHEAGHWIFRPFPRVIVSLGGTLNQLLMPLICAVAILVTKKDPFGASVAVWWMFENLVDCAPYVADAGIGEAPLLGGNFGKTAPFGVHDWQYILTKWGVINYDQTIARGVYWTGIIGMVAAIAWGAYVIHVERRIHNQARSEGKFC